MQNDQDTHIRTMKRYRGILPSACGGCFVAVMMFVGATVDSARATVHPVDLRCEYLENPSGIDVVRPRLSWKLGSPAGAARGIRQTAYQILVASSDKLLDKDQADLWDSGKVAGDQTIHIEYDGKPLASRMECHWKVRTWTSAGEAWSQPARWSMGLLETESWKAEWIGLENADPSAASFPKPAEWIWFPEGKPAASAPVGTRYFRRVFDVPPDRKIVSAELHMTADNSFSARLNKQQAGAGTDFNAPARMDVTRLIKPGTNVLSVTAENIGPAANPAGLIAFLKVTFADGDPLLVHSDAQWKSVKEVPGDWEGAGFKDGSWGNLRPNPDARPLRARYLRREFDLTKDIRKATAYICGLGFFDLYINGSKTGDHLMDPALSDYGKAAYYLTFDVTGQLARGRNTIAVALGNGRFFAPRLRTPMATADFGFPKLRLQTEITYTDGSSDVIVSDGTWKVTDAGPITANNEYDGEAYDARLEMPGWNASGFDDSSWKPAQVVKEPGGKLLAQMIEPMRVTETIKPVAITEPKPGIFIVDMGRNFYGTVRMKARGPRGAEVRLTSAYSLLPDGTLKTADNRHAMATDAYVFKGDGEEVWNPRFKGQGYRRVQVTGFPGTPRLENFEGLVIHTDVEPVGEFACSNKLIDRIHMAMRWGMRMFLRSTPMDPDRDERQSWMGDPAKDSESEAFNFNVAAFYTKWMDDVRRSQRPDGSIPEVSMYWDFGMNSIDWPSVYTIIPDWYVDFYGDKRLSQAHYETMKRWVLTMEQRNRRADGTYHGGMFGDWCDTYTMDGKLPEVGKTDVGLVHSAYHYNNCRILSRAASRLGKAEDVALFDGMAETIRTAFNKAFLNPATGIYANGTQTSHVLPLAFGMVPAEHRDKVIGHLVNDIMVTHNGHLSVGLIGMQWLMQTLTDIGRPDVAWTIATQTTRPSWGYMMGKGATTIWERWDTDTRDPGMNSEALLIQAGNLDAWFYQTLAGINYDRTNPGFKHIIIRPRLLGDLAWVKCHYDSLHGRIVSHWKRDGDNLTLDVTIPPNTTATVHVPANAVVDAVTEGGRPAAQATGVTFLRMEDGAAVYETGSGSYRFGSDVSGLQP